MIIERKTITFFKKIDLLCFFLNFNISLETSIK